MHQDERQQQCDEREERARHVGDVEALDRRSLVVTGAPTHIRDVNGEADAAATTTTAATTNSSITAATLRHRGRGSEDAWTAYRTPRTRG